MEAHSTLGGGKSLDCPLRARLQGLSPSGPSQSFHPAAGGPRALSVYWDKVLNPPSPASASLVLRLQL